MKVTANLIDPCADEKVFLTNDDANDIISVAYTIEDPLQQVVDTSIKSLFKSIKHERLTCEPFDYGLTADESQNPLPSVKPPEPELFLYEIFKIEDDKLHIDMDKMT